MRSSFYLLNLTVSGVKNLKQSVRLDFYKKTIDKSFDPERYRVKAIYGENGSGKSAIVTAVKIFRDLINDDNYLSESKNQIMLDEIVNKETKEFKFECEFIFYGSSSKRVYGYSICLGKNNNDLYEIKYEKLMKKNGNYPNNNYKTIFECEKGEVKNIALDGDYKELILKKTLNLLSAHSLINLYMNCLHEEEVQDVSGSNGTFLVDVIVCNTFTMMFKIYLAEEDQHELYFLKKRLKEGGLDKQVLGEHLIDLGVSGFYGVNERRIEKTNFVLYEEKIERLTRFIKIFKSELMSIDIDKKEDGDQYICELILNYGSYRVNKEFESTGIKKLIRLFDSFFFASSIGIVFIDEMDSNLNDVYLCKLIEYFMYYGKGQLCFTTHNLDPMIVLKENKNSIDFLSGDNNLVQWTSRGNSSPDNCYRNGMIEDSPFNVDATDFIGIFGE